MRLVLGRRFVRSAVLTDDRGGHRARRGGLITFSFVAGLMALALCASAAAAASKQAVSSFGSLSESGSFGGEFSNPRDVAVNETGTGPANAGDTYVADEANNRIERFDSAGNFVSAWGKDTIAASVNERQSLFVEATKGTFTLSFGGSTTTPIEFSIESSYQLEEKLAALPSIGAGNITVSGEGTTTRPFVINFIGALAGADQPQLTADTTQLTGTVEISTIFNGTSTTASTGTGFETCTVATQCKAGVAAGENGALNNPQSVAVDQDTGNVYVSDRDNRRIDEYDGVGNFIRAFGFDVAAAGPGNTGTGYEICNQAAGDTCKTGEAGAGVGQFGEGSTERGFGLAISPPDGNAASGTVYLADSGNRRVDTFKLDGTNPASFGSSAQFGEEQPRSVAVDSRGIVYASDSNESGDVQRYDSTNVDGGGVGFLAPILPSVNEVQEISFTGFTAGENFILSCPNGTATEKLTYASGEIGANIIREGLKEACGAGTFSLSGAPPNVTVTFEGALGGANQPPMTCSASGGTGSCSVTTITDGRAAPLLPGGPSSATAGLAVNAAGTTLYVLRVPTSGPIVVQQFGPTHEPGLTAPPSAADEVQGAAAKFTEAVHGFGFDNANGQLYIAFNGDPDGYEYPGHLAPLPNAHRVYVLAEASSLPSPTVSTPSVTGVGPRGATFHDEVDPKGGIVSCAFEYSTDQIKWTSVSTPICANLNQNGGPKEISRTISGLIPNTQYFARLQVIRPYSGTASVTSAAQSFTTAGALPAISEATANAIDQHSVRISAKIDPSHSPTTYVIEYGTSPTLGTSSAPVSLGSGTEPVEISPVFGGLAAATKYYFKIVATNGSGPAASEVLTATTFSGSSSFGSCPNELFRTGPSANLPDCRAYEQVTPTDKFGSDAYGGPSTVEASNDGERITSYTFSGFPNSEGFQYANSFLSRFAAGEWLTNGTNPPPNFGDVAEVYGWTPDLRLTFARVYDINARGSYGMVVRDSTDGTNTEFIPQTAGGFGGEFTIGGAFDNDSEVVFEANGAIPVTSGPAPTSTEGNVYLYDRTTGELTLAGLLPNSACSSAPCVPSEGSKLPPAFDNYVQDGHVVSPAGDIYFTDRQTGRLYVRHDAAGPTATTVLVSASQKTTGGGPGGVATNSPQPAKFEGATPDGSKAFFTSTEDLTNDANTGAEPSLTPAIGRATIDGITVERNFLPATARWVAVDATHLYWTDPAAGTIGRANIDGSAPEPNFITGLVNPEGIAVDSGHIYWAEARDHEEGHGTIGRAAIGGGSVEKEFITALNDPRGVAVGAGFIYWTTSSGVDRATVAGANAEVPFIPTGEGRPTGIAVDANHIYFIEQAGGNSLYEYNLQHEYVQSQSVTEEARGLAVDSNYLYVSDLGTGKIGRRKLDLSKPEPNFVASANGVFGIAVDAGHIYWAGDPDPSGRPAGPGRDLYRYDAASGGLIDVAPDSKDPVGADVVGVLGYSNAGSYVYFSANADLDGSGPAQGGNCTPRMYGSGAGTCSVYLWRADGAGNCATAGGCLTFVAPLDADGYENRSDSLNWESEGESMKTSRVSADGQVLVFRSQLELTGYANVPTDGSCGEEFGNGNTHFPCPQFFRYDAASGQISCMTCSPVGAPPFGAPDLKNPDLYHAPSSHAVTGAQPSLSRNLSADGTRFFFQSTDKLVPADVNGESGCPHTKEVERGEGPSCRDVYEWEAPEAPGGSCTTNSAAYSPANGGCTYLLSTGTGIYPSYLADVSESGNTVFIFSRQKLVPSDEDNLQDIYAVKVNGGLASQNTPRPALCEGDACRGPSSQAPTIPGAGTGAFQGPGNPKKSTNETRCPKGKRTVRRKGKSVCVAKHKKHGKTKHKKHGNHHKRTTDSDRRTSR